jgi:hypothetical protein
MKSSGMGVSRKRIPHTIEVLNGLINNKLPWYLGGDLRIEAFYRNIKMPIIINCIQIVMLLVSAMKDCTSELSVSNIQQGWYL